MVCVYNISNFIYGFKTGGWFWNSRNNNTGWITSLGTGVKMRVDKEGNVVNEYGRIILTKEQYQDIKERAGTKE